MRFMRRKLIFSDLPVRLEERVLTANFKTKQTFGPASKVRRIQITKELRGKYER